MRAWLALFFGIICIAFSAIFIKISGTSPISVAYYRMVFAVIGAIPIVYFSKKSQSTAEISTKKTVSFWKKYQYGLVAGIFWGINLGNWSTAVANSNATIATLLNNLAPIWTGIYFLLFFNEKSGRRFWLGLGVAMLGVGITFWPILMGQKIDYGTILGLFGSFLYAFYQIFAKKARDNGVPPVELLLVTSLVAGVVLGGACLVFDAPMVGFSAQQWVIMAAAGLVSSVIGWSLVMFSMGKLPVTTTSLALLNQAVVTAILDYFIFGAVLESRQLFGGGIILLGLILVVSRSPKLAK